MKKLLFILIFALSLTGIMVAHGASSQLAQPVALFETTLASRITTTDTSMTLTSAMTKDGTNLASSTYGFIIDEGTASEEFVMADCTGTTCTNMSRGISVVTGTSTVTALKKEHRRSASVKMTDAPILVQLYSIMAGLQNLVNQFNYNTDIQHATTSNALVHAKWVNDRYVDQFTAETITGHKTFSSSTINYASTTALTVSGNLYLTQSAGPLTVVGGKVTASSTLSPTYGGTGLSSYTKGDLIVASSSSTLSSLTAPVTGKFLRSNGTGQLLTWENISVDSSITGSLQAIAGAISATSTLSGAYGGTGLSLYTIGDLLYANSTTGLGRIADVAAGNVLLSGGAGTAPGYGPISSITGTLGINHGGTGTTTNKIGFAICYLSATQMGHCSNAVQADGSCTCVTN